jgi:thiol-disulfide isomerase/thioredoxin
VFFLALLVSLMTPVSNATASPAAPAASATPAAPHPKWDECVKSTALPYNHPLGLKMRVLDGPDFDLTKYRGQAVLMNIFATWCGPCNHEMPALVKAATDYEGRGLQIVSIDDREPDDAVRAFREKYGITYPIAMDEHGGFSRALEVQLGSSDSVLLPVTLFIDSNGYLSCQKTGPMTTAELRYRIEHLLGTGADTPATSTP